VKILVLNSGSSSLKSRLYQLDRAELHSPAAPLWQGEVQWSGERATLETRSFGGTRQKNELPTTNRTEASRRLLETIPDDRAQLDAIGLRIVNAGTEYTEPAVIDEKVKAAIQGTAKFAPLHNQIELEGIALAESRFSSVPQIAVFDTGFHRDIPLPAAVYPGPYEWFEKGIRRLGFHGINHRYCAHRAAHLLSEDLSALRIVTCHLGNGCSLAAIRNGQSIDTTMGFTPLEGLMMGTRSGSVDPGILTHLLREEHLTGQELDELLNKKSGLLGISGVSGDMREIAAAMGKGNARAKLAFEIFIHRLQAGIAAMTASLGGIDVLVFTAGIGENSPEVRAAACENLAFLGLQLDISKNRALGDDRDISTADSEVRALVIRAEEDWAIALECARLLNQRPRGS
jgi:acetate kinase